MVIDPHHHFLPSVYREFLLHGRHPTSMGGALPEWNAKLSLDLMDRNEIDSAVLSISETGVFFGDREATTQLARACNEAAAELVAKHKRFGALGVLPLPDVEAASRELEHALDVLKLDGVILPTNVDGRHLGDAAFEGLFQELNKRNAVVYVHPVNPPWYGTEMTKLLPYLCDPVSDTTRALFTLLWNGAIQRHGNIKWLFAHGAGTAPYLLSRLSLMLLSPEMQALYPNGIMEPLSRLHYDTGMVLGPTTQYLMDLFPTSQILFGTDYPFAPEKFCRPIYDDLMIRVQNKVARDKIFSENAKRLFPRFAG